jgi:hypothetical protein
VGVEDSGLADTEITFRWNEVASVELRGERLALSRVHGAAAGGELAGLRGFLTDAPVTLELDIGDSGERSCVYEALAGSDGLLRDRALSFSDQPAAAHRPERAPSAKPEPFGRIRRRMIQEDVRSGALPLAAAGWVAALGSLALATLGLDPDQTSWCSWHAASWVLAIVMVGPPVAAALLVLGRRRLRHDSFDSLWLSGYPLVVLISLVIYGSAVWLETGHCL